MRLRELTLYTCNIGAQKAFCRQILGLPFTTTNENHFEVRIGSSRLLFTRAEKSKPYHIAINIPSFQEKEALHWLKSRVEVLPFEGQELVDFKNWNAKSIYFYDADKNIVEFIARRNLNIITEDPFSVRNLVEISELGVAVDNVRPVHDFLKNNYDQQVYDGNLDKFCAIGDEHFLFIVIDQKHKHWMPNNDQALPAPFEVKLDMNNGMEATFQFKENILETVLGDFKKDD